MKETDAEEWPQRGTKGAKDRNFLQRVTKGTKKKGFYSYAEVRRGRRVFNRIVFCFF